jgi:hypothetical protein
MKIPALDSIQGVQREGSRDGFADLAERWICSIKFSPRRTHKGLVLKKVFWIWKKIMVLLKRNLEGPRVHSYVAACTANLQELYLSQSGVLLLF